MADVAAEKATLARIAARAAELMIERPEATVMECLEAADEEDLIINGDPDAPRPQGLIRAPGVKP